MTTYYEYLPIFEVNIFYTDDLDELRDEMYKYFRKGDIDFVEALGGEDPNSSGLTQTISLREDLTCIVAFVMFVNTNADIGTVSHEATHIKDMLYDFIGQEATLLRNDEVSAYLVGHLAKTFSEQIRGYDQTVTKLIKGRFNQNIGA